MPAPPSSSTTNAWHWAGGAILALGIVIIVLTTVTGLMNSGFSRWAGVLITGAGAVLWFLGQMGSEQRWQWIKSVSLAIAVALVFRWGVLEPWRIPSDSMDPTLHGDPRWWVGDRVFVNKWTYGLRLPFSNARMFTWNEPERWDIVVFSSIEDDAAHPTLVKRIVALPGERVQIHSGKLHINGEEMPIPPEMPAETRYTSGLPGMKYGVLESDEYSIVPDGHYLVLGDNSANSRDGRYFGWLPNGHILGPVTCIWWPPGNLRDFSGFSRTLWWRSFLILLAAGFVFRAVIGRSWTPSTAGERRHLIVSFITLGLRAPLLPFWAATWSGPERGELVLYSPPGEWTSDENLRLGRVVALPGDTLEFRNCELLVNEASVADENGKPIDATPNHPDASMEHMKGDLKPGRYFVLEIDVDDKDAVDSRVLGPIPLRSFLGVVVGVWWPLTAARLGQP